ncbi:MAG TPA: hypothetical protein VFZ24_08745 [Longimicrobiales bacterium]
MLRSRITGALLVMAAALTACESDPLALDEGFEQIADDDLQTALETASGVTDPRGSRDHDRRSSILEELAAAIPGFGGIYRTAPCVVAVVLTEDADVEEAVRIVHAILEPIVARTCPTGIRVDAVRGQFTFVQLHRFLLASRPLNRIDGVGGAYISFRHNRLVVLVASRSVAEKVVRALPGLGIPPRAVIFRRHRDTDRQPTTSATATQS